MDWIVLAADRDRWRAVVNAVMNLRVSKNAGNFLRSWGHVNFSVRPLLHGAVVLSSGSRYSLIEGMKLLIPLSSTCKSPVEANSQENCTFSYLFDCFKGSAFRDLRSLISRRKSVICTLRQMSLSSWSGGGVWHLLGDEKCLQNFSWETRG
jgi:hypothetical protein